MKAIKQRDFKDCGVTCLEYIIEYYGGYVSIETLREDTFTDQHGTTAFHLVETLKKYGFDSFGQKLSIELLKQVFCPCIVHLILNNGLNHFAILEKVQKNEVVLMDPSYGKRKYSFSEFSGLWDGVVLQAIPNNMIPRFPKSKSIFLQILKFIKKERICILMIVFFHIITSFLTIMTSFYIKIGISKAPYFALKELYYILFIFATFYIFKMLFEYLKQYFTIYLDQNVDIEYMYSFLKHLFLLPVQKFHSYHEGELITRVEEAREIKNLFHQVCITFFLDSSLGLCSFFLFFFMNQKLSLLVLIGIVFYVILGIFSSKYFYRLVLKNMEIETKWNEFLVDSIRMFSTMKHLNQFDFFNDKLETSLCETSREKRKISKQVLFLQILKTNFLDFFYFFLISYGIWLIKQHELAILDFITFQSLYFYFIHPIKELVDIGPKYYYMRGIFQKISETMNWKEEKLSKISSVISVSNIEVKNLSFTYHQIVSIFKNVNFEIYENEHVFFSGPSGCGKSTFCKILIGELMDYGGEIYLAKKNLKDYELSFLRSSIVYLSQGECLMAGTIKENILFGKSESNRFFDVVQLCNIEEIVSKTPFRYDTHVSDETLSGGERQRIMLARTLMQEGSIYILDECLSEVEKKMEIKIIEGLHKFLEEKTLIYISHTDYSKYFERSIYFESQNCLE